MLAPSEVLAQLRVGAPHELCDATMRSYLSDGRAVGWYGPPDVVVDAERHDVAPPRATVARYGAHNFWARWTAAECRAKLADVPVVLWLREHGLDGGAEGVEVVTVLDPVPGVTVSVARVVRAPQRGSARSGEGAGPSAAAR